MDKEYFISSEDVERCQKDNNIVPMRDNSERLKNIQPLSFTEINNISPTPIEYVFYPCLPTQGIAFIYAATGLGKTLFTLNLAYAIAGGGGFLKYKCPKIRKVLYVDGEMPFNQLHARLLSISKSQGKLYDESYLKILTPDRISPHRIPNIDNLEDQELYVEMINQHEIEVIVFDNLSMLTSIDENKSNEWKIVQDFLLRLRSQGKSIIVIHHSGKDKNGYRGTSRMLDCADTAISLQPVVDDALEDDNQSGKRFKIVYQKNRNFGGKDALAYEAFLDNDQWSYQSMEKSDIEKIREFLNMKMSQRDIAKELNLSLGKVNKLIQKERNSGAFTF